MYCAIAQTLLYIPWEYIVLQCKAGVQKIEYPTVYYNFLQSDFSRVVQWTLRQALAQCFAPVPNLCEVAIHIINALPEAEINQCTSINFELGLYVTPFIFVIAFS